MEPTNQLATRSPLHGCLDSGRVAEQVVAPPSELAIPAALAAVAMAVIVSVAVSAA
jgi:hypothetical protein